MDFTLWSAQVAFALRGPLFKEPTDDNRLAEISALFSSITAFLGL